jgi:5'-phosphate synthase pdxT subunit
MSVPVAVGVLALQGGAAEHLKMLSSLEDSDLDPYLVYSRDDLGACDALILPGGESTALRRLLAERDLITVMRKRISEGMPVWGTCAGLILLASRVTAANGSREEAIIPSINITAERNSYGSQLESFIAHLPIGDLPGEAFEGVFIRAPRITGVGPSVSVTAVHNGSPVACSEGNVFVTTFHPELTDDSRIHRMFVFRVKMWVGSTSSVKMNSLSCLKK